MITVRPVGFTAEVSQGTDLPALLAGLLRASSDRPDGAAQALLPGDVLVVTSKIVSKWLGLVAPADVARADLVLEQSRAVVAERATPTGVTRVVQAIAGPVMAAAGIDASNSGDDSLLLLPEDADAVARRLRREIAVLSHRPADFAVVLSDTSGRPWREGVSDFALGAAGLRTLDDLRGLPDTAGRDLAVTVRNIADELAAAADLVKGKIDRVPVAVVSGMAAFVTPEDGPGARPLVRTGPRDWFGLGRAEAVRAALGVRPGSPAAAGVGIASVLDEPVRVRADRAARVALAAGDEVAAEVTASDADHAAVTVRLSGPEPMALGRAWARLEVALAGERLTATLGTTGSRSVELAAHEAGD